MSRRRGLGVSTALGGWTALALLSCADMGSNDLYLQAAPGSALLDVGPPPDGGRAEAPYFEGDRFVQPRTHVNVVRRLRFMGVESEGVAKGFDLDGVVSASGDEDTCGHADLIDPDGKPGIDNQLAVLWSTLYPLVGEQVDALLQNAINEGRVLMMFELADVDDLKNDDDVTLNVYRGALTPDVGTQGLITPDQTYDFDYDQPVSSVRGAKLVNGRLEAGPLVILVPILILDLDIVAELELARVRLDVAADGTVSGFIGGALSLPKMIGALLETGASAETELVQPLFEANADLFKVDGKCTFISLGMTVEGTRAYVLRDPAREGPQE